MAAEKNSRKGLFSLFKSRKKKNSSILPCGKPDPDEGLGTLIVMVRRSDNRRGIRGVQVELTGPDGSQAVRLGSTDGNGAAIFSGLEPGGYDFSIKFPQARFGHFNIPTQYVAELNGATSVAAEQITKITREAQPTGDLKVTVVDERGEPVTEFERIFTEAPSPEMLTEPRQNPHVFSRVKPGVYDVAVKHADGTERQSQVQVPEGGTGEARLVIKPRHWIGVRVEDEQGRPVSDVKIAVQLTTGVTIMPALQDGYHKTEKLMPDAGQCRIYFPDLFDMEWWPKDEGAAERDAGPGPSVADGDCVSSIADRLGLRDYRSIWDRSANNALKQQRPNPNAMVVGDSLAVPMRKVKRVSKATDQDWTFVVKVKKPTTLKIILLDNDDKPLTGAPWTFSAGLGAGTTAADGAIEVAELDTAVTAATLAVKRPPTRPLPVPPTRPPLPTPPDQAPPYPAPINKSDFKDKDPDDAAAAGKEIEWSAKIGSLPSFNAAAGAGAMARLHNLGYPCRPGDDGSKTERSVKSYQKKYLQQDDGSGQAADIQADLKTRHDDA